VISNPAIKPYDLNEIIILSISKRFPFERMVIL